MQISSESKRIVIRLRKVAKKMQLESVMQKWGVFKKNEKTEGRRIWKSIWQRGIWCVMQNRDNHEKERKQAPSLFEVSFMSLHIHWQKEEFCANLISHSLSVQILGRLLLCWFLLLFYLLGISPSFILWVDSKHKNKQRTYNVVFLKQNKEMQKV